MLSWKVLAWVGAAGAVVSLAAGIVGGNRFGTVLLRALVSALLAGGLGFAAQRLLRRFLPELGASSTPAPPPGVDILVDEELPMVAGEQGQEGGGRPGNGFGGGTQLEAGLEPEDAAGLFEEPALDLGEEAESEALPELGSTGDFPPPSERAGPEPDAGLAGLPELESGEGILESTAEAPPGKAREALPADGLPDFDGFEQGLPSRRSLKAGELEAQLDNVMQGQDPVSLAKAVRTFLHKDQEG